MCSLTAEKKIDMVSYGVIDAIFYFFFVEVIKIIFKKEIQVKYSTVT